MKKLEIAVPSNVFKQLNCRFDLEFNQKSGDYYLDCRGMSPKGFLEEFDPESDFNEEDAFHLACQLSEEYAVIVEDKKMADIDVYPIEDEIDD